MNETLHVALGEQAHLKDFFTLMKQMGQEEQARNIGELLDYMELLRGDFEEALDEIKYLKDQIILLNDKKSKNSLLEIQQSAKEMLEHAKQKAGEIQQEVVQRISDVMIAGKQKGIQGAAAMVRSSHIGTGLSVVQTALIKVSSSLAAGLENMQRAGNEWYVAKSHMKSAGTALLGKEIEAIPEREAYQGILGKIEKSMQYCQGIVNGLLEKTIEARARAEHFSLWAQEGVKRPTLEEMKRQFMDSAKQELPNQVIRQGAR